MTKKADLIALLTSYERGAPSIRKKDWERIFSVAEYSRVSPLLFSLVKSSQGAAVIPPKTFLKLKKAYQINLIRNTLVEEEFRKAQALFDKEGISFIMLKGICLLHTVYKERRGVRILSDADILVKEADAQRAGKVLEAEGFRALIERTQRSAAMYFKRGKDGVSLLPVHLHWHIVNISLSLLRLNWSRIEMQEIWRNSRELPQEEGGAMLMMCPEHMLLSLCEHGFRHGFARLDILYDIYSVILNYQNMLNWENLADISLRWGLEIPLSVGLLLTQKAFPLDLPARFLEELRPQGMSLSERIFMRYVTRSDFPSEDACILLYLAANPRIRDKLKFIRTGFLTRLNS